MTRACRQAELLDIAPVGAIKSPLCIYQEHCGAKAVLGPPVAFPWSIQREIRCLRCGRTGESSTRVKEHARDVQCQ